MDDLTTRLDRLAPGPVPADPPAPFLRAVRRRRTARIVTRAVTAAAIVLLGSAATILALRVGPWAQPPAPEPRPIAANDPPPAGRPVVTAIPTIASLRHLNARSDELILPSPAPGGSASSIPTVGSAFDSDFLREWAGES